MSFDCVVVGGGLNGLTAAALLAGSGRKVGLIEAREQLGGLAACEEFHPGYHSLGVLHHTGSVRQGAVEALGLRAHGLTFEAGKSPVLGACEGGPGLLLAADPDRAADELRRQAPDDVSAYQEFRAFLDRVAPVIRKLIDQAPPDLGPSKLSDYLGLFRLGVSVRRLGRRDLLELARVTPMCVADWVRSRFHSDLLQAVLAAPALEASFAGPWSPGTAINLLLREAALGPEVEGGAPALVQALVRACQTSGVELMTGRAVTELEISGGAVEGVRLQNGERIACRLVLSSLDPRQTFLKLVPPGRLPVRFQRRIGNWRVRGTAAKLDLALSRPLTFAGREGESIPAARTGHHLDHLERAFDAIKYRGFSERPLLDVRCSSQGAPGSGAVASVLVRFVPHTLEGGFDEPARARLLQTCLDELTRYVPDVTDTLVGSRLRTPEDLESEFGLTGGHLHHGELALDQMLSMRPDHDCARYRTPVEGLSLCGGGSHPGGGLTLGPGWLAARTLLA